MLNTEEVNAIVGYICNRCFLGRVPAEHRNVCHHCARWSNEEAAAVQQSVKERLTNLRDAMLVAAVKELQEKGH